ncbi:YwbE family protein [Nitrosarchaeum sp.]|uniref:YwbE family protein n=1 Tax=Nitrosarchaeum sp. TaxID=2026886 RepID=UPI00247C1D18|nr:YwbE family protein [Nitrosarchaeum sp.]MCV0411384.1 YwbE family protein [Nitrosarchaeum sp.]
MPEFPTKKQIKKGSKVAIELKKDQGTGKLFEGIVKTILTSDNFHPHGIMVELADGNIGRVKKLLSKNISEVQSSKEIRSKIYKKLKNFDVKATKNNLTLTQSKSSVVIKQNTNIPKDEDTWNEFKSTFQYDMDEENLRKSGKIIEANARQNNYKQIKDALQKEISLTISAFANQEGGRLFVGVNNDSTILGLERDLRVYSNSIDKFTLAFTDSLKKFIKNNAFISKLKFEFATNGDKQYLVIQVPKSNEPIFVNTSNGQEVYVRIQKSSEKFSHEDFLKHCKDRFPNWMK